MPYSRLRSIADFAFLKVATRILAEYSSVTSRDASSGSTITSSSPWLKNRRIRGYISGARSESRVILNCENDAGPGRQPPQQPLSSLAPQSQFGPQEPSCSLWRTGSKTVFAGAGAAPFFLFARSSIRLPMVGSRDGGRPYF